MRKIFFITLLIVICKNTTNAQIKIVGDDYAATMTGSKEYYDRDVDFDKLFPLREQRGRLYPYLSSDDRSRGITNMLGDTVYLTNNLSEQPQGRLSESFIYIFKGNNRINTAPAGYYTIDGYIFCSDNAASIASTLNLDLDFFDFEKRTVKSLKEEILRYGEEFNWLENYLACRVLKSTTDSIFIYVYPYVHEFNACLLKFYNEAAKFIGNEVVFTSGYHKSWDNQCFYTAPFPKEGNYGTYEELNNVYDALTRNLVRLEDTKYEVTDIVLKDGVFYVVFTGAKTGSFSMEIHSLLYAYFAEDIDENYYDQPGNSNGDVACMEFRCPGTKKGTNDPCNGTIYVIPSDQIGVLEHRSKLVKAQQEKEVNNRKLQRDREKEKQETAFRNKMVAKYGDAIGPIIGEKQVSIGMTEEMCCDAWGKPMNTYRTTTKYGQSEVWCYNYKTRIYFFDGKVVQIDN